MESDNDDGGLNNRKRPGRIHLKGLGEGP